MTLEDRVEVLERELRWARRRNSNLVSTLCALGIAILAIGAVSLTESTATQPCSPDGSVIRAKAFLLEDEKGNMRARLAIDGGVTGLRLFDENGRPRASLFLGQDGPALSMADENGNLSAGLGALRAGPSLMLLNKGKTVWQSPPADSPALNIDAGQSLSGKAAWRQLRKGVPADKVRSLLGEPQQVQTDSLLTHWCYSGDGVLGPHVTFNTDTMTTWGWVEPK